MALSTVEPDPTTDSWAVIPDAWLLAHLTAMTPALFEALATFQSEATDDSACRVRGAFREALPPLDGPRYRVRIIARRPVGTPGAEDSLERVGRYELAAPSAEDALYLAARYAESCWGDDCGSLESVLVAIASRSAPGTGDRRWRAA